MSDADRFADLVRIWWDAVGDLVGLLEDLDDADWASPTDLPGWTVRDIAAHIAHIEAVLAGTPETIVELDPAPAHARGAMGHYTEQGVRARRDRTPDQLIAEIRDSAAIRRRDLLADPPADLGATPARTFGGLPWSWLVLLRNRPLDVWMHEQDIRRATGRPGNIDSPAGRHTVDYLSESLGFVLAKKAAAPAGTTLVLAVEGHVPVAFRVTGNGRGAPLSDIPREPTVGLSTDPESFVLLAGGRREPDPDRLHIAGDAGRAAALLEAMAVTP